MESPYLISNTMNEDVLVEILTRLDLKSLSRFKCVSKSWRRIISDDYLQKRLPLIFTGVFFRSEIDHYKDPKYAYTSENGTIIDSNLNFFPFHETSTIVDGCNGLLLYYLSKTFYVVNTTTKKWVTLPKSSKTTQLSILAFDPYCSSHYKVICFTGWRARGAEVEIYSSETGLWDLREIHFGVETDLISTTMLYFNGVLYVLAYPNLIVSINLTKISCELISLPEQMCRDGRIGHCQGHLQYAHIDGSKIKFWMLKNSNEWIFKYEVNLMGIVERESWRKNQVNLLAFHPEKDLVYFWVPRKMVSYNLRERKLEGIWEFEREREKAYLIQVWLFPCSNYLTKCLA